MKSTVLTLLTLLILAGGAAGQRQIYNYQFSDQGLYDWTPLFAMPESGYIALSVSTASPVKGCEYSPTVFLGNVSGPLVAVQLVDGESQWSAVTGFRVPRGERIGIEGAGGIGDCSPELLDVSIHFYPGVPRLSSPDLETATPEPGSLLLIGSGVLLLAAASRARR
jgi:hypothetical protein